MIVAFYYGSFRPPWGNEKMLIFEAIQLRLFHNFFSFAFSEKVVVNTGT